ncbi:MAG: hypothetical protein WCJ11_06135 [Methylococcaceae bacterium]
MRLMQRICWNTKQWQSPTGSTNETGFPNQNKFAHEEWNFQLSDCWNGFIFPYFYLTPQQERLDESGGKFDVGFFTQDQENKKWFLVGIHHDVQLIDQGEYRKIIKTFEDNGIFERRAKELSKVSGKFKTHEAALKEVKDAFTVPYVRFKAPISGIELFSQLLEIERPSCVRFATFTYLSDDKDFPKPENTGIQSYSAFELEKLPDFAQVELWDFYQFLLQKYQAKTEQEDLEDYELDKIVKARQVKKPFAVEVSLNNL